MDLLMISLTLLVVVLLVVSFIDTSSSSHIKPITFLKNQKRNILTSSSMSPKPSLKTMKTMKKLRAGGETTSVSTSDIKLASSSLSTSSGLARKCLATWGVVQVVSIILQSLRRLYPIALEPLVRKDLTTAQWGAYVLWALVMAYSEGYKGFQQKFSPLLVKRAFMLVEKPSILNYLLAGPYCMGLFGATKKRMIVSWALTIGVVGMVSVVRRLPYPYRSIVDGGVVVGLTYGVLSIFFLLVKGLFGSVPDVDPCFQEEVKKIA